MEAFLEWLSSHTLVTYPFKENATLTSTSGFVLPKDAILDLTISGVDSGDRIYLREMFIELTKVTLTFASVDLAADIISLEIPLDAASVREVFSSGGDPNDPVTLRVVPGDSWAELVPIFTHEFTVDDTEIEPSIVVPLQPKILSIDAKDDINRTIPGRLVGDVLIADGCNMLVNVDETSISFDAGPGLGTGPCLECLEDTAVPKHILTINGIGPNPEGQFKWQATECVEVRNHRSLNMLVMHDHCRPCCDCTRLTTFDTRVLTLEGLHP